MTLDPRVLAPGLFAGQTVLVTGGGRGIGRVIALRFAELGAKVVIGGRTEETLERTRVEIEAMGVAALAKTVDIRQPEQVDELLAAVVERFGSLDVLINNAGGQFPARPFAISDRGWRSVVDLNLNGTWTMCNRVGKHMVGRGSGAIVNIVHVYSLDRGAAAFVHSGAARAGVVSMTRTLAQYLARHGVTINALAPGSIETAALHDLEYAKSEVADYADVQKRDIPAQRLGTAEEVAEMCAFLGSPAARYVNGAVIVADGGQYLGDWTPMWDMDTP